MPDISMKLELFLRGEADPARFPHREHIRMGFEMLRRHSFPETALRYSNALRAMTTKIGKPQAFHQTVTIAFLSLIAERLESGNWSDFESFAENNADLIDKSALARWYTPERLATEASRRTFLLPDSVG